MQVTFLMNAHTLYVVFTLRCLPQTSKGKRVFKCGRIGPDHPLFHQYNYVFISLLCQRHKINYDTRCSLKHVMCISDGRLAHSKVS